MYKSVYWGPFCFNTLGTTKHLARGGDLNKSWCIHSIKYCIATKMTERGLCALLSKIERKVKKSRVQITLNDLIYEKYV